MKYETKSLNKWFYKDENNKIGYESLTWSGYFQVLVVGNAVERPF